MNEELNLVFKYCNINKLSINFTKTTYMIISSARLRSYIHIPDIVYKTQIKYLGIYIDPIHKWLPIKNSFVNIKISPTNLVFELIIQKNFYFQTRLVGLI